MRRTLAVSSGADAPTGDPSKPIGRDQEDRLEAKGQKRRHL